MAGGVDHEALAVSAEIAGPGIDRGAVAGQGEEALAGNRHVQRAAGEVDVALAELLGHGLQAHAGAGGNVGQAVGGHREQVAELRTRLLEAGGVDVGDVVGGDVEVLAGGVHAADGDAKAHGALLGKG